MSSSSSSKPIRIGYVPEHYLIPLHLAKPHLPESTEYIPFPSGTGHMITSLRSNSIDLAIGLTEGWVAGLLTPESRASKPYSIVGSWVRNPLRWAVVTGRNRDSISSIDDLKNHPRVGVSRIGSGSHIMAFVLAEQRGWLKNDPAESSEEAKGLELTPLGPFKDLRDGVTSDPPKADFFMWEHFTTKPYFDGPKTPLKHIGEIYTPWPSWHIAASSTTFPDPKKDATLAAYFEGFDKGVKEFNRNPETAIQRLVEGEFGCEYSEEDANDWMVSAQFFDRTRGVDGEMLRGVVGVLETAGVVERVDGEGEGERDLDGCGIVGIARS